MKNEYDFTEADKLIEDEAKLRDPNENARMKNEYADFGDAFYEGYEREGIEMYG